MTDAQAEPDGCSQDAGETAPTLADAERAHRRRQAMAALASSQILAASTLQSPCSPLPNLGVAGRAAGAAASLVMLSRLNERLREAITEVPLPPQNVTLEAVLARLKTIDDEC